MRFVLPIRSRAATWLLLPALALTALYSPEASTADVSGYWTGAVSSGTVYAIFSCGLGALAASIDASRIRKSKLFKLAPSRSPLQIAAASVWPTVAMSAIIQAVGFFFAAQGSWGSPGRFPWEVILAWAAMILFHISLGYLLGLAFPVVAAAPLALLASYVWLGFTWSVSYFPLRYLSGLAISGCCNVYTDLAPESIVAVTVFSIGGLIAAALLIVLQGRPRRAGIIRRIAVPVFPVAVATVVGLTVASALGGYSSAPRSSNDLKCKATNVAEICFYPEQLWAVSPSPVDIVHEALQNLDAAGIPTPNRVSGRLTETDEDTLVMLYRRSFTEADTRHSLSSEFGYLDPSLNCSGDNRDPRKLFTISKVVTGIIYHYASVGEQDPFVTDVAATHMVTLLLSQSRAEQLSWLSGAVAATKGCDAPLPELALSSQ